MSTTTNVNQIKLNIMTKEQYDSATKSPTELYMVTDADPEGQTIQVDTLPEASESEVGKIYQYVGETDLNYTNGYFYKCFEYESGESGESPYYWEQIEVQPAGSSLPDQTGQSGKFLTTDGTDASWGSALPLSGGTLTGNLTLSDNNAARFGNSSDRLVVRHYDTHVLGIECDGGAIGINPYHGVIYATQGAQLLGDTTHTWKNVYTEKLNGGSDINVPNIAGVMAVQVSTLPTAASTYEGQIYQFTGTTDSTHTNGCFYKCVALGTDPETYEWQNIATSDLSGYLPLSGGTVSGNISLLYPGLADNRKLTLSQNWINWGLNVTISDGTIYSIDQYGIWTSSSQKTLGLRGSNWSNVYTKKISSSNTAENMDIIVPHISGKMGVQLSTMPTAAEEYLNHVYQYTGATDTNYTNGYFYKCVSDGQSTPTYSWTRADVQPTPAAPTVDQTYNPSSTNAQSGTAVAGAISSAISSVYRAAGSVTFANLPNLSSSIEGYVYDISDSFTTTADFVEGAGNTYPAGTNVVCINTAASGQTAVYKWDVLSALADLSGYLPLTGGTVNGTITIKNDASGHYTPSSSHIKMYAPYGGSDGTAVELQTRNSGVLDVIGSIYEHGDILAAGGSNNLGSTLLPWTKIYVKEIGNANGTSISVPDNVTSSIMAVQMSTVPTATAKNDGQVVQYVGTTDSNYINGYFYKSTTTAPDTATITQTVGSSLSNLAVDASTFVLRRGAGTFTYIYNGSAWVSGGVAYVLNSHGITYTGTPVENDEITVVAQAGTHVWSQVNVQPGSSLPSQTGNAGKFLTTDGTNASWREALVNTATGSNSLTILGTASTRSGDIVIGTNAIGSSSSGSDSVVIGRSANYGGAGGNESVALGALTRATGRGSISIGRSTFSTGTNSIAMGYSSRASGNNAIQFGTDGTQSITDNTDANTFKVANANGNFEIMSADGTIPTDRFTTTPSTDGNYVPTLSISSGTATRSWTSIASSVSSSSTNAETVGAKLFYDTVGDIVTLINAL